MDNKLDAPPELLERLKVAMIKAWNSPGSMMVEAQKCIECENHFHIMICPSIRELVGGEQDGEQIHARFILNINKLMRAFDSRPKVYFDTAQGQSVPHIRASGKINGYECDVAVMSCPPSDMPPLDRVYTCGPKQGVIEIIEEEEI